MAADDLGLRRVLWTVGLFGIDHTRRLDSGGEFYFLAPGDRYNLQSREAERPAQRSAPIERVIRESWTTPFKKP